MVLLLGVCKDVQMPEILTAWTLTDPVNGNRWCEQAEGCTVLNFPIWLYCDDTSAMYQRNGTSTTVSFSRQWACLSQNLRRTTTCIFYVHPTLHCLWRCWMALLNSLSQSFCCLLRLDAYGNF